MFEELFTPPGAIERYRAALLAEPRERYLRHLAESEACRLTLRQIAFDQVRLLDLLDLREGETVTVAQIEAVAPEWDRTRHHKLGHRPRTSTVAVASGPLCFDGGVDIADPRRLEPLFRHLH